MDYKELAKQWMTTNKVEPTFDKIITLSNLLIKAEREGYKDGINEGTIFGDR